MMEVHRARRKISFASVARITLSLLNKTSINFALIISASSIFFFILLVVSLIVQLTLR
jgi:hypothetical protein